MLPPNINEGQLDFRVANEGTIHFGLGAIKGVGFKAVEAIVKAREQKGPFLSLDDFFERVSTKEVGAGCVETLIHAGAFDCLGAKRSAAPGDPAAGDPGRPGQTRRPPPRPARALRRSSSSSRPLGMPRQWQRQRPRRGPAMQPARRPRVVRRR